MDYISGKQLKEMLIYGSKVLSAHKDEVNALNVFPVPDGDTGSNMNMTINEGVNALSSISSDNIGEVAKAFSKGLLRGARGNSGVILSQFFRGLSEALSENEHATASQIELAMTSAKTRAYSSVISAVEGTILTVAKDMDEKTLSNDNVDTYFDNLYKTGMESLNNTPNLLPILKEAGVVDSGGAGLMYIIEGMRANLKGEELDLEISEDIEIGHDHNISIDEITFKYCTEMLLKLEDPENFELDKMKKYLETQGDSIVAIQDEEILKVHVHTNEPIKVFNKGLKYGEFVHVKSENMVMQAIEAAGGNEQKDKAIVTVSSSNEMSELFNSFTPVTIIEGGQTLNPSVDEIVKAIEKCNAKNVIFLPNNSNIIMAAKSAKELVDCNLEIIETKHFTQAVELLQTYNEMLEFDDIINGMKENLGEIINIEITNAIKDTSIEGVEIKENDYLGIVNGKIKNSLVDPKELITLYIDQFIKEGKDLITILVGEDGKIDMVNDLVVYVNEKLPFTEVHVHKTMQPVYSYLISAI